MPRPQSCRRADRDGSGAAATHSGQHDERTEHRRRRCDLDAAPARRPRVRQGPQHPPDSDEVVDQQIRTPRRRGVVDEDTDPDVGGRQCVRRPAGDHRDRRAVRLQLRDGVAKVRVQ
ncbi:hypothetical protein Pd630_LPD06011 [Rhodococcus opacus PD630]|nr:hypothetical protein Pd630_LPD06011 [Rhodococcus opacus PD630]